MKASTWGIVGALVVALVAAYLYINKWNKVSVERAVTERDAWWSTQLEQVKPETVKVETTIVKWLKAKPVQLTFADSAAIAERFNELSKNCDSALVELLKPKELEWTFEISKDSVEVWGSKYTRYDPATEMFTDSLHVEGVSYPKVVTVNITEPQSGIDWGWVMGAVAVGITAGVVIAK